MRTPLFCICLSFFLTACQSPTPKTSDQTSPKKAPASAPKEAKAKPDVKPQPKCKDDDEDCFLKRLGEVNFGWLYEGTTAKVMMEKLGKPDTKEERIEEGATGDFIETWTWKKKGVSALMTAPNMTAPINAAGRITITAPCELKTNRGVGIGSTEAEVRKAYVGAIPPLWDKPGQSLIAGSVYGGVFFDFKDGKVTSIFIGAGAE